MLFHGNSFRKSQIKEAVNSLEIRPEAKVKLKNALWDYGRADHIRETSQVSVRAMWLPDNLQKKWEKRSEARLENSEMKVQEAISILSNEQRKSLANSATKIMVESDEKKRPFHHIQLAVLGSVVVFGVAAAPSNPLIGIGAGVGFGLLVLGHAAKKYFDYFKAKDLDGALERINDNVAYRKALANSGSIGETTEIRLKHLTNSMNRTIKSLDKILDSLPF